jgi:rubrerythrin
MQESTDAPQSSRNRTGQQTSPALSEEMNDIVQSVRPEVAEPSPLMEERLQQIREADPLGSVPPLPAKTTGARGAAKMTKGDGFSAFIDKLAERLAYERGGTRLYDAVLAKATAYQSALEGTALQDLREIREEEAAHAGLLRTCLEQVGADATAQTPSADLVGVMSAGLLQAASDPRTTLAQTLQAALAAELIDVASWETLIALAESIGQADMATRFGEALQRENEHLVKVRKLYERLTLSSGGAAQSKRKAKQKSH